METQAPASDALLATTLFGLEEVLATELRDLGAQDVEPLNRAVAFRGDKALMYRCNLHLRTALKVLKPIARFTARNDRQLYNGAKNIDWGAYLTADHTFVVDSVTNSELFRHSHFAALKTKDAIVDQFREKSGKRPSIDTDDPDLRVMLHISDMTCTLSLDSSGATLDKRGYRLQRTQAPINEVLAAGIIKLTGWDEETELTDPMCGAGTFPIEAALMATRTPPGVNRKFGFTRWNDFDAALWKQIQDEAARNIRPCKASLRARDLNRRAMSIAQQNAERAGVEHYIEFYRENFLHSRAPSDTGLLILNPPYGERLQPEDIEELYAEIGTQLKHKYPGYDAWIVSAHLPALKHVGLRPSRKIPLFNGALECKLHHYALYSGSKKASKQADA